MHNIPTKSSDPIQRAEPFLQQCGSCDAGLPMACTCPAGDYRPVMSALVIELEDLRKRCLEPRGHVWHPLRKPDGAS